MSSNFLKSTAFLSAIFLHSVVQAACPSPGTGIVSTGATVTESGCTVTTDATDGTSATLGGAVNFSNGSVTTTGVSARGAYVNGVGSTITLTDVSIATSGGGSYGAFTDGSGSIVNLNNISISTTSANGLFLNSGTISFNTGSVLTTGGSTNGAQLLGTNALLTLDDVNVQTAGVGLFVQLGGNTVNASNCTIITTANGGRGVDAGLGSGAASSASLNNCIINVPQGVGPPSLGAVVARNGCTVSVQDSTINSEVYGVHTIATGASITVDNSIINVNATVGTAVFGAYAQNDTTITLQNNTTVTTTGGNNTHGFAIQDGSTGNLIDS